MSKKRFLSIATIVLAMQAVQALAAPVTLWDNGGPAVVAANQGGSNMSGFHQAADFTTTFASDLSSVSFWSLEAANTYTGSIFYRIVGNSSGSPDDSNILLSGSVNASRTNQGTQFGLDLFQNDFSITLNNLAAGTYWLELHNGALGVGGDDVDFFWAWSDPSTTNGGSNIDQERSLFPNDPTWGSNGVEHAFLILGDAARIPPPPPQPVPEPGSLLLTAAALSLAMLTSRRRRQS